MITRHCDSCKKEMITGRGTIEITDGRDIHFYADACEECVNKIKDIMNIDDIYKEERRKKK